MGVILSLPPLLIISSPEHLVLGCFCPYSLKKPTRASQIQSEHELSRESCPLEVGGGGSGCAPGGRAVSGLRRTRAKRGERAAPSEVSRLCAEQGPWTITGMLQTQFSISLRVPDYTAILDDGSRTDLEAKDHVLDVNLAGGYSMRNLLDGLATKTIWGTCQEPAFWFWNKEKKGLQSVITDTDLDDAFHVYWSRKILTFVVEFNIKPCYQKSFLLEQKMERLPLRRDSNQPHGTNGAAKQAQESEDELESDDENVDPTLMDDVDIFMDDDEVFVSLGLRAEEVAARLNIDKNDVRVSVDAIAENEPSFVLDKENPNIKIGQTFPTMKDFRMASRQYAIKKEFAVRKFVTDKERYTAECKAKGCPWRIVAHKLQGQPTVEVTKIPNEHDCVSSGKCINSIASKQWVAERVLGWLRKDPDLGAADLQDTLLEKYGVEIGYDCLGWKTESNGVNLWGLGG